MASAVYDELRVNLCNYIGVSILLCSPLSRRPSIRQCACLFLPGLQLGNSVLQKSQVWYAGSPWQL